MKILFTVFLVLFSLQVSAGGTSEEIDLVSLIETKKNEYTLKYKSMESRKLYTVNLSYSTLGYFLKARFLTQEKYDASISLLKQQIAQGKLVRFGWFGGGPCIIDKTTNTYRSDALEIYNEGYPNKGPLVVYAFCEYS